MGELDPDLAAVGVDKVHNPFKRGNLAVLPDTHVVGGDTALGDHRGRLDHDAAPPPRGHRGQVHKVPVGRAAVVGRVWVSTLVHALHMHIGATHSRFGNSTPRIVMGWNSLGGLAFSSRPGISAPIVPGCLFMNVSYGTLAAGNGAMGEGADCYDQTVHISLTFSFVILRGRGNTLQHAL